MWAIDRFEGDWAIIQNWDTEEVRDIPRTDLPSGAKPGMSIRQENGAWITDLADTKARKAEIQTIFDRIKKKNGYL
ncbi:MAG: DUF3006 domain-containing protein [Defluviitaleaceae bacterium]|nr:DUF3006 domain-containing protein [Defluviitaleaceae bacterium]